MPPLAWQNAVEDVGYISDETSPLFRSPCINGGGWSKPPMMNQTGGKDDLMNFWTPIPFPKWQFHLTSQSPVGGVMLGSCESSSLNAGDKFTHICNVNNSSNSSSSSNNKGNKESESISNHRGDASAAVVMSSNGQTSLKQQQQQNAPIFINDSPIQSGSVISISSSSDDDDEEDSNDAAVNKTISLMNTSAQSSTELGLRNIEFNFAADTPSPLNGMEMSDTKSNIPSFLGGNKSSNRLSHNAIVSNSINDTSSYLDGKRINRLSHSQTSSSCSRRKSNDSRMITNHNSTDNGVSFQPVISRLNSIVSNKRIGQSEMSRTTDIISPPYSSLHSSSRPRIPLNGYSNCHIPSINLSTRDVPLDSRWEKRHHPCYNPCCDGGQQITTPMYEHLRFRSSQYVPCASGLHRFPAPPPMSGALPTLGTSGTHDGNNMYTSFTYFSR